MRHHAPDPVDLGDLDLSGLSREDILSALIDAAIIGAPEEAEFSLFGEVLDFSAPTDVPVSFAEWDESKHPRGQPENKGEFGPGGGGGSAEEKGGEKAAPAPAQPPKRLHERGQDIARTHHNNMIGLLLKMQRGDRSPQDVLEDVENHRDSAVAANYNNFLGLYNRLSRRLKGEYGEGALDSPEWEAVRKAFRESREATEGHIRDAADNVQAVAEGYATRPDLFKEAPRFPKGSDDVQNVHGAHDDLVSEYYKSVHRIADAVDAFKAKHGKASFSLRAEVEAPFYSPDQLRDERGRWTAGGASGGMTREEHAARREASTQAVRDYLKATHQPTREETAALAGHLSTLTVKQLHELRKEHGLKDPRQLKADFVNSLHGYFEQHRQRQAVLARGRDDQARRQAAPEQPEPHQALAAAVQGKKGFTLPFASGPYHAVRHNPTGLHIEAESGTHGGRFAVINPQHRTVHDRFDTAPEAVRYIESGMGSGTTRSMADREQRDRAAQVGKGTEKAPAAGKADAGEHQARLEQEFNRLLPAARGGLVSIPELRQRLGLNPADFEHAVRELDNSDRLRLVAIGDRSRHTKEQLSRGIAGENETFMYVEPGPHHAGAGTTGADFATKVVEAAKVLPNTFGNARDPSSEKWLGHKVYVSDLHDHLKPTLGGMGLEDFKRNLLQAHLGGKLTLLRDDIAGTQSHEAAAKHVASEIQHLNATFHTVDAHGKPRKGAGFSQDASDLGTPEETEDAMSDLIPASVPFSADGGGEDEGRYVLKDAPVVFRAGRYDFPADKGGPFEMTAEDIRAAVEAVPADGVPISNEHNQRCFFQGKLGRFLPKAWADFGGFGGVVKLAKPVLDLVGDAPIKLSANFDRLTKRLKDVTLTHTPRITDAALFAAFSQEAGFADGVKATPHGQAAMQMMHDMSAQHGAVCGGKKPDAGVSADAPFTSQHEHDGLQAIHDTTTSLGADCQLYAPEKDSDKSGAMRQFMAQYSAHTAAPTAREKELEKRLAEQEAKFNERVSALEKSRQEAAFSAALAGFAAEARAFVDEHKTRLYGKRDRDSVAVQYVQAARDDYEHPAEVHFSAADGTTQKGTRLAAFKASILARPETHLDVESIPGPLTALFAQDPKPEGMSAERRKELLQKSEHGRQLLRERERANGSK